MALAGQRFFIWVKFFLKIKKNLDRLLKCVILSLRSVLIEIVQLKRLIQILHLGGDTLLTIDVKSRKPIYEQIIDNIKELIIQGVWSRDTQLPSVRQLAGDLAINPNTIQKAYSELERQGIIYSMKSKGSFVASGVDELRKERKEQLFKEFGRILEEMREIGITSREIEERLQEQWKGVQND